MRSGKGTTRIRTSKRRISSAVSPCQGLIEREREGEVRGGERGRKGRGGEEAAFSDQGVGTSVAAIRLGFALL